MKKSALSSFVAIDVKVFLHSLIKKGRTLYKIFVLFQKLEASEQKLLESLLQRRLRR